LDEDEDDIWKDLAGINLFYDREEGPTRRSTTWLWVIIRRGKKSISDMSDMRSIAELRYYI
jgi:hypothetical protein